MVGGIMIKELPLFLAAQFVGCVLVPIVDKVELSRKDNNTVPHKQILWMEVIIFGPSQKSPLVLHIKLN